MKFKPVLVEVEHISGDFNPMEMVSKKRKENFHSSLFLDVVPDFVTLGKSMGNGFPVAALITRKDITEKFDVDGIEYFNTYGGNPVSCRAAIAVLDVIENEHLQENALQVGEYFLKRVRELQTKYELIGDVRGRGLFLGVEITRNRKTREPGTEEAKEIRQKYDFINTETMIN